MSGALDVRSDQNQGSVANPDNVMPLHHVDSLRTNVGANIGDGRVTGIAQNILNYDPEAQVWQDSPSLSLMFSSLFKWAILILVWIGALAYLAPHPSLPEAASAQPAPVPAADSHAHGKKTKTRGKAASAPAESNAAASAAQPASPGKREDTAYFLTLAIGILVIVYQVYQHCVWALRLKNIKYKMSSQRLMIDSGIFSKKTTTHDLHKHSSTGEIQSPFFPRLCGRSNLWVGLWLSGIRNAEAVRDLIRNAGQIEASRIDKARFR